MVAPELVRGTSHGVTLLGDPNRPGGVTLAFTERTGGVSAKGYASLNVSSECGDDARAVRENRRRALAALGSEDLIDDLLCPRQVHGDRVVVAGGFGLGAKEAREEANAGADAIVCALPDIPVLVCVADCLPLALVTDGAFALVHSGWKGTMARIGAKALRCLMEVSQCVVDDVHAYIGPHIGPKDYEVSAELAQRFADEFGFQVLTGERNVDLGVAVKATLMEEGMDCRSIVSVEESTASHTDRFFSYRAQAGDCGRQGVFACMRSLPGSQMVKWQRQ